MSSRQIYAPTSDTRTRIIDAGIHCVIRDGVAGATMAAIASESEVSKALLHYHFADRGQLLAEMVTVLGHRLTVREGEALKGGKAASVVDVLWRWTEAELRHGELRALLELGVLRMPALRQANEEVRMARRTASARTVDGLFRQLGLTPRVPVSLIAHANIVFVDGLALASDSSHDERVSFDVFWLGMLSLGD